MALHRLNRTEYATAVEQLLGVRIDARSMLPADMASEGFDNVAEVLRVTPTHIEQYVAAARDISILAVGEKAPGADARRLSRRARTAHGARRRPAARHARRAASSSTTSRPTARTRST